MQTLWQDLRYGVRMLLKKPGFTVIAVITLGLGIGANTAIFSVINGVLLKSLPYPAAERLVTLSETSKEVAVMAVAYPNYLDWQARQTVFESLAAWWIAGGIFTGQGEPERVTGRWVTASLLPTLGVQPQLGRFFTGEEDRPGGERVMVLGHNLWQRRFGGEPQVIGRSLQYNSESWTVIGVMPADFDFYGRNNRGNDFFILLGQLAGLEYMQDRHSHMFQVLARLRPGVTLERARDEMSVIAAQLAAEHPASNTGNGVELNSLLDDYVGNVRPALLVITAAVGLVLLIACINVAHLLLAQAATRRKEIAVRVAIGAGRRRIVRQLLTESLLLAVAGGAFGLLLAAWGVELLVRLNSGRLPRLEEITIDPRVLGFTLLVTLLTGVIFGLAPALQSTGGALPGALKEGGRQSSGGAGGRSLRSALVVAEIALALVLLAGAGLLVRSFQRLMRVDTGFDARNVLTMRLRLPDIKYRESAQTTGFLKEVMRRVQGLPGVERVSVATGFPLGMVDENGYWLEGQPEPKQPGDWPVAFTQSVSESYHQALGITLLAGRRFTERDTADSPQVVIVDEDFVRRHFPRGSFNDALGKRLRFGGQGEPWREIVGVTRHIRHLGPEQEGRPGIYRPWLQMNPKWLAERTRVMDLVVKTSVAPAQLVSAIKREVQAIDKDQPLANVRTLESYLDGSLAPRRFSLLLLGAFAVVALLLGAVGLYGVISYAVTQRTNEIGIRLALGAQPRDVLRLVLGEGMRLVALGVALGLAFASGLMRLINKLLYDVSASDPLTFAAVALLLTFVALLACWMPARRAMNVDPMVALKSE
jgi:putative ABC transport system permease protein